MTRVTRKRCIACGEKVPLDGFHRHRQMADGHLNKCKVCVRKYVQRWKALNPAKVRAWMDLPRQRVLKRLRGKWWRDKNREKQSASSRAHAARYPERMKARRAVTHAIRDGRLKKRPCERCGAKRAQAHHHDYSKPLEVRWFCSLCHGLQHRKVL